MQLWRDFTTLFFPRTCLGCHRALLRGEDVLCSFCIRDLPLMPHPADPDNLVCQKFFGRLPVVHATALLYFRKQGIAQHLLHALKYQNCPEVGDKLGRLLGAIWKRDHLPHDLDLIVPVPLHAARLRARGYNQSARFARGLSQELQVPVHEGISIRRVATTTQTKKSRWQRWQNVADVFAVEDGNAVRNAHVLLVDDVVTTGATLEACGHALLAAGCGRLSLACMATA